MMTLSSPVFLQYHMALRPQSVHSSLSRVFLFSMILFSGINKFSPRLRIPSFYSSILCDSHCLLHCDGKRVDDLSRLINPDETRYDGSRRSSGRRGRWRTRASVELPPPPAVRNNNVRQLLYELVPKYCSLNWSP